MRCQEKQPQKKQKLKEMVVEEEGSGEDQRSLRNHNKKIEIKIGS